LKFKFRRNSLSTTLRTLWRQSLGSWHCFEDLSEGWKGANFLYINIDIPERVVTQRREDKILLSLSTIYDVQRFHSFYSKNYILIRNNLLILNKGLLTSVTRLNIIFWYTYGYNHVKFPSRVTYTTTTEQSITGPLRLATMFIIYKVGTNKTV